VDIHDRIRRWRESQGITQAEMARRVGVHPSAVCKWESGEQDPLLGNLEKVAEVLGVKLHVLLGTAPEPAE
jgi:transcriptional regulator with XRE-family HTH domain